MRKLFYVPAILMILLSFQMSLKAQIWKDVYYGSSKGTVFQVYADKVDDLLYVAGNYDTLGPDFYPSRGFGTWDGNQWVDWTGGNDGFGNDISKAVGRYNGEIYHSVDIGAVFYGEQTEEHRIAKFACTNPNCHGNTAYAFQEYQGELYVGGTFRAFKDTPDDMLYGMIKWNGTTWSKVGGGVRGINTVNGTGVHTLFVYQGLLYAGGTFDSAGTVAANNIAVWDGTTWSPVGLGVHGAPEGKPRIESITSWKGDLVVGGVFDSAGNVAATNVARWDGTSWKSLNANFDAPVKALCVYKKVLYAGGDFNFAGQDSNHIAKYDGITWSSLGGGMTGGKFVRSLCVWKKMLVVGGAFTELEDTIKVGNVATWTMLSNPAKEEEIKPLVESEFKIAPNIISCPAVVNLSGPQEITRIEVIDESGRLYMAEEFSSDDINTSIKFHATNWDKGMYKVRLHTPAGIVNKKIVVQ